MIDQVLAPANLSLAWEKVLDNKGAPGIDQVTVTRWNRHWEENLYRLAEQVRGNTYHPNPPKRIQILKENGRFRELSLLTITDRVLQRAVLNIIEPVFDRMFLDCSHGYRPKRSVSTAIQQVLNYRDHGLKWVVDADIRECYYSLDHALLIDYIKRNLKDWHVLNLIESWLLAGRKQRSVAVGVPMGAVISPLCCNIYLHHLDSLLSCAGVRVVRYADDFVCMSESEDAVKSILELVKNLLASIKLEASPEKTRIASFTTGFRFLGVDFLNNTYAYVYKDQTIQVTNRNLRLLYEYPPEHYR